MLRILPTLAALFLLASPLAAQCLGENLIAAMSPDARATLQAKVDTYPYSRGNFWRATRQGPDGDQVIHLIGTYHLDDPRHKATLAALAPVLDSAATLLVEAGPDEEAAVKAAIARDPSLMFVTEGPTLPERLTASEWDAVTTAMRTRGIPPFLAAKMQPWYLSMMLGIPPCGMTKLQQAKGLDAQIIDAATARGLPPQALEPFDTVFKLFAGMTDAEQLGMIRSTLPMEAQGADYAVTLADAYFAGDSRLLWEFLRLRAHDTPGTTPAQTDAEFAMMEEAIMSSRNRAWIPVIEAAVAKGPVLAAFGALHLPGKDGVLNLLVQNGFAVERLPL